MCINTLLISYLFNTGGRGAFFCFVLFFVLKSHEIGKHKKDAISDIEFHFNGPIANDLHSLLISAQGQYEDTCRSLICQWEIKRALCYLDVSSYN